MMDTKLPGNILQPIPSGEDEADIRQSQLFHGAGGA